MSPRKLSLYCFALVSWSLPVFCLAQSDGILNLNDPIQSFLLRQETAGFLKGAYLGHQPLSVYEAHRYLDSLNIHLDNLSPTDRKLLAQYRMKAPKPGHAFAQKIIPGIYRNGHDLISFTGDQYAFQVNPLLYSTYGQTWEKSENGNRDVSRTWQWSRGAHVSGHIGNYLFVESRFTENKFKLPWPGNNALTTPRLGLAVLQDSIKYDYFNATGILGLRTKYVELRVGRDNNLWALGKGSLFLSNFAPVYDQIQIRTTTDIFQYVYLFGIFN